MKTIILLLIDFYRKFLSFDTGLFSFLAPGGACRQTPTCSLYTRQAIIKYGLIKGLLKGGKRIITCR
ncbi:MAG: membrane protein insertion efficiency factor YidD [Candidatus Daviesbacteria bacterium]|nr:membrane protein insertion efficiency factor YidD [Candidatus Daviesbacteria bacterium]